MSSLPQPIEWAGGHNGSYRAHCQYRDDAGTKVNICGPDRQERRRAETDLDQMRAAGAVGRLYYPLCGYLMISAGTP